jgi:hypothetical protein
MMFALKIVARGMWVVLGPMVAQASDAGQHVQTAGVPGPGVIWVCILGGFFLTGLSIARRR